MSLIAASLAAFLSAGVAGVEAAWALAADGKMAAREAIISKASKAFFPNFDCCFMALIIIL